MKALNLSIAKSKLSAGIIFDVFALAFVYCVPALTHYLSLPVYYIDPMRLMLVLAMAHSGKNNAYFLAFTLPVFSYIISAHPVFPKMLLICAELYLNAFLFYFFKARIKRISFAFISSILISKTVYYALKAVLINMAIINMDFFATPLLVQALATILFTVYIAKFFKEA